MIDTDRGYEEVLSVLVQLPRSDGSIETLNEMFVAPTPIVRAFAEFLSQRTEREAFAIKNAKVLFVDVVVSCADSNKAVQAFKCFKHYNIPLGNYDICDELCNDSDSDDPSSDDSHEVTADHTTNSGIKWIEDINFQTFKSWWRSIHDDCS